MAINPDSIFGLFDDEKQSESPNILLDDVKNTPTFKIGMFKKIMEKCFLLLKTNPNVIDKIQNWGYINAWDYLQDLDINNPQHMDVLQINNDELLPIYLDKSLKFFENIEEYEKCAHIKKILDLIKTWK